MRSIFVLSLIAVLAGCGQGRMNPDGTPVVVGVEKVTERPNVTGLTVRATLPLIEDQNVLQVVCDSINFRTIYVVRGRPENGNPAPVSVAAVGGGCTQ